MKNNDLSVHFEFKFSPEQNQKDQSINNRKTNDKDVLETNRDQPNNRYHQDRER